ncbi:MAG TPA: phosphatidylglycerophosphatase A, partial [Planctomycetota bacterium]|nr:phosphatidylglycerophosphatase A [Planctomycetota bacterium]
MNRCKLFLVSCGFLGCSPWAPGTVGTLGGVAIAWGLSFTEHFLAWTLLACAVVYLVGRSLGDWSERYAGQKDPGIFVLDEVLGYLVTVAWTSGPSYLTLVVGFFVFRFFDIFK